MRIALINGSPKRKDSVSGILLQEMEQMFRGENETVYLQINRAWISEAQIAQLKSVDTAVFAFPVYVDAVPAHFLAVLEQLSTAGLSNIRIFSLANCGFYEGIQTKGCHEIIKNWCEKCGLNYCGSVGIGGGGSIKAIRALPLKRWPKYQIGQALNRLAFAVENGGHITTEYATVDYPRSLYKLGAEISWRIKGKANGLQFADLKRQL